MPGREVVYTLSEIAAKLGWSKFRAANLLRVCGVQMFRGSGNHFRIYRSEIAACAPALYDSMRMTEEDE